MAEMTEISRDLEIRLQDVMADQPMDLLRVLHFISGVDADADIFRRALERCPNNDRLLNLANAIANDALTADKDPAFRSVMATVYGKCLVLDDHTKTIVSLKPRKSATPGICWTLARCIQILPLNQQKEVLKIAEKFIPRVGDIVHVTSQQISRYGAKKVGVALSAVFLAFEAIQSIHAWYKGEISGKRACKTVVDAAGGVAGGFAGGWLGGEIGAFFGPVGVAVGIIAGSIGGSLAAEALTESLTRVIFDVPQSVALENAYNYFGVSHKADNEQLNKIFKNLCLKHHPDKGGNKDEFIKLNSFFQIIKEAREG